MAVPEEHRAPYLETPLLMASLQDCHTNGQVWYALPGAHYYMPAGGCRGIYSRPHLRCKPLHHSCKMGYNYAQGYSVSPPHPRRASTLLKSSPEICFRISVGCRLCRVLTSTGVGKLEWDVQPGWLRDFFHTVLFYFVLFFHPAQSSWSEVF